MKRPSALVLLVGMLLLAGCAEKTAADAPGGGAPVGVAMKTVVVTVSSTATPVSSRGPSPSLAPGRGEWAAVACGSYHTLALKQDGTLWAWGLNDYGQLGRGTIDGSAHVTPIQVGHARDWASVSAGYGDSFAGKKDGTLWAWGNNTWWGGNLGLGDWEDRYSPARVGRARDWAAVSCGYEHTLALKKDGSLWAWGINWFGGLGLGSSNLGSPDLSQPTPTEVGNDKDWAVVAPGGEFTLALKKDGTLWAWGSNAYGNLGLGDTTDRLSPTQVGSANDWLAVRCLAHHAVVLKQDGTLWAWGENSYGQLGLGDTTDRHTPTQVGSAHDWAAIAPGGSTYYHSLALKQDGTLWSWGFNQFGQLGLGDTSDRHTPTQVGVPR